MSKYTVHTAVLVVVLGIGIYLYGLRTSGTQNSHERGELSTIGVVTPLSGDMAYYGESTRAGITLAQKDLTREGVQAVFIIEDGGLDPRTATDAGRKLLDVDRVQAIYADFMPSAFTISELVRDRDVLFMYNAAPESPLTVSDSIFKTYFDYKKECETVARHLQRQGVDRVGILEISAEPTVRCTEGVTTVYGEHVFVESYEFGERDFRTRIAKLLQNEVEVVFNISFQQDSILALQQLRELGSNVPYVNLKETMTTDVIRDHGNLFSGTYMFGLPDIEKAFVERLSNEGYVVADLHAAALAYVHSMQLARALDGCSDLSCATTTLAHTAPSSLIGFIGFEDRAAVFNIQHSLWDGTAFVPLEE